MNVIVQIHGVGKVMRAFREKLINMPISEVEMSLQVLLLGRYLPSILSI